MKFEYFAICSMAAILTGAQTAFAFQESPQFPVIYKQALSDDGKHVVVLVESGEPVSKYWIGIACHDVSDALRSQLGLAENVGVLVGDVVEDGPAHKAGIQKHDILLKMGDTAVKSPKDVLDVVQKAEKNELSVELIRKGQKTTLKVAAQEREFPPRDYALRADAQDNYRKALDRWQQSIRSYPGVGAGVMVRKGGRDGDLKSEWIVAHPGIPVPTVVAAPLPPNVSITIARTNDDPAKITVKRGDKSWEVTDKELDQLPADLRPYVERMLAPVAYAAHPQVIYPNPPQTAIPGVIPTPNPPPITPSDTGVAKKSDIDALKKQLEDLLRKVEALQERKAE